MSKGRTLAWSTLILVPLCTNAQLLPPDTLSWSMANSAQCVKAGDLDGDGDNEVVVGTLRGHHVLLYWNPGDGEFGAPQFVMEAEGVYDLELADVDRDGLLDIVVADFGNGWVSWCANLGGGSFAPRAVLIDDIFTTGITALEVGQGDADPEVELFTLNYNGRVGLFQDNGSQQFGTGQTLFVTGPPAFGLDIYSFTGTFRYDVVAGGDAVWMRSNTGPGFLASQPVELSSMGGDVSAVAFNRGTTGSLQDALVFVASEGTGQQRVWSGFQNGTPSLASTTAYDGITDIVHFVVNAQNPNTWWSLAASHSLHGIVGQSPFFTQSKAWGLRSIAVADMNGDGITDLLWCGDEDDDVAWVRRDSSAADHPERRMTPLSGGTCPPRFADLDGDGDQDGVIAFREGRSIAWIENQANTGFSEPIPITTRAYGHSRAIPADLDGDGDLDVLTAYAFDSLLYFPNDGTGGFGAPVFLSDVYADASYLEVRDVEGDGDADILTVERAANGTAIAKALLLNNGSGAFSPSQALAQGPPRFHRFEDVDGDALPDVVDLDPNTGRMAWYRNLGGASFAAEAEILPAGALGTVRSTCVGDADGDGDADLLVAGEQGSSVHCLVRTPLGWDPPALLFSDPSFDVTGMAMGDLDDDGDADLLTGRYDGGRVVWYTNTGNLTFGPGIQLTDEMGFNVHVDVVDLNGDGEMDGIASSIPADRVLGFLNGPGINTGVAEGARQPLLVVVDQDASHVLVQGGAQLAGLPVWLFDGTGRSVRHLMLDAGGAARIGVDGLAAGAYTVVAGTAGTVASTRVVLQPR